MIKAKGENLEIKRFPSSSDKSLKAWSAADELLIQHAETLEASKIAIYHDTFGYLSCQLSDYKPTFLTNSYSQEKSLLLNLEKNDIAKSQIQFKYPLEKLEVKPDLVLVKVPKSVDLFELYLSQIAESADEDTVVLCGFMTRNFSVQALKTAEKYFSEVSQSKAQKKARLMILKGPKNIQKKEFIHHIPLDDKSKLQQYYGVFSAHHIDYASQYLMEQMLINPEERKVLDIGCGNGVLAYKARQLDPSIELFLTDDSYLAIESAKLNLEASPQTHFYLSNHLNHIAEGSIDLAISNPPFHFEYENNMNITLDLFLEIHRCLNIQGRFLMVANQHLNYATHLKRIFQSVKALATNDKFVVYECLK